MLFSSLIFLWYFLPVCAALYYLLRRRRTAANLLLLAASLIFYAWGEPKYIFLMAASIALNYAAGPAEAGPLYQLLSAADRGAYRAVSRCVGTA